LIELRGRHLQAPADSVRRQGADRRWTYARTWPYAELSEPGDSPGG